MKRNLRKQQKLRNKVSKNITKACEQRGIGKNFLAWAADVSPSQLYDILRCSKSTTTDTLDKLSAVLQVPTYRFTT